MTDLNEFAKSHTEDEVAIFRRSTERHRTAMVAIRERADRQTAMMVEALEKSLAAITTPQGKARLVDTLFSAAQAAAEKCGTQVFATFAFDPGNDGRILAALEEYFILQQQLAAIQVMASELHQAKQSSMAGQAAKK